MKIKEVLRFGGMMLCVMILFSGCNRGAMRLYGVGGSFPPAATGFTAKTAHPQTVSVEEPVDKTADYYGKPIAGTSWQGTRTNTFSEQELKGLVRNELSRELNASGLFSGVDSSGNDLVLETEIRAFGAQARGFMFVRIGGVAAFKFTLKQGNTVLLEKVYEKVVKDNDDEYTGSSVGMLENAMRATMSDSFREVLKALFKDLEALNV